PLRDALPICDAVRIAGLAVAAPPVAAAAHAQWTADGVALCTAANDQYNPPITADGAGGAIVTWRDFRSGTSYDIYAQRVNADGVAPWTADGVALCTAANPEFPPQVIADASGGAIPRWLARRRGASIDL